jgi:hypothetical protein
MFLLCICIPRHTDINENLKYYVEEGDSDDSSKSHIWLYNNVINNKQPNPSKCTMKFDDIRRDLDSEASNIRAGSKLGLSGIQAQLDKLEDLVETVAKESSTTKIALEEYHKNIASLKKQTENEILEFTENAKYTVRIYYELRNQKFAFELAERIASAGFKHHPWELK